MSAAVRRAALVTGGAGFVGSHLVDRLVRDGWRVRVLDDFSSGREANLEASGAAIELVRGDLRDAAALGRAVAEVEVVFHQAAVPSVPRSVAEPVRTHEVNATGTLLVLEAARRAGVRRLVYAASSSAYGDTPELPKVETMPPRPRSPYALQKWTGECYCRLYSDLFGLETVALRYFNVFGPRQDPKSEYAAVVPRFATACLRGEAAVVYGDGEQTRDFTFVDDAVRANVLAADAPGASGAVVNVAGGRRVSLNELLAGLQELTGTRVPSRHEAPRAGDVRDSLADLSRARALLGYEPAASLREGLLRTVESLRKEQGR
ncbi:MAG TPA: SDR family oxidoreductase [Myxococcota bacterium]|nr:SDR family oxidoreductase [Myxococcota bacterium]